MKTSLNALENFSKVDKPSWWIKWEQNQWKSHKNLESLSYRLLVSLNFISINKERKGGGKVGEREGEREGRREEERKKEGKEERKVAHRRGQFIQKPG